MPRMGESITEVTILNWLKDVGDTIVADEIILEVATDKVDSEVPAPCDGVLSEIKFEPNVTVGVGKVIAIIDSAKGVSSNPNKDSIHISKKEKASFVVANNSSAESYSTPVVEKEKIKSDQLFLSPLVINIAQKEHISVEELQDLSGTGMDGRVRKSDVIQYVKTRKYPLQSKSKSKNRSAIKAYKAPQISFQEGKDRIIEMDRMRQMIADHMVYSKQTAPHVTSYIEVDVTNLVQWRNRVKDEFMELYGEKLTFTPIFIEAVAKAITAYPLINVSVDKNKIIAHKDINIGMATALPTGNLIVPVVKNADEKNLMGLAKKVNHLASNARNNCLKPDEIQGSTFTISNVGTFGSLMGTPIINQPEVAILALGIIKKRPEVITTDRGDEIAIRSMMYLSLSFDHRVVDGYLGGSFLRKIGDELENFDTNRQL